MTKVLPLILLIVFLASSALTPLEATAKGLVPCGGGEGEPVCTPCHAFELGQNILKFIWGLPPYTPGIVIPLAILMLSYGGFLIMVPGRGGNMPMLQKGQKILRNTFIGLAIVFLAWIIIDVIIKVLAGQALGSGEPAKLLGRPWNTIDCSLIPAIPTEAPPTPTLPPPSPTPTSLPPAPTVEAAARVLVAFQLCGGSASCGGVNSCSTLRAAASSQPLPVCFSGCTASSLCQFKPEARLNLNMLNALISMRSDGLTYTITSLTTGSHSQGSAHYEGRAVDLIPQTPSANAYSNLENALRRKGGRNVQCELRGAAVPCSSFNIDHIHAEF